jgi:hypothetical protein
MRRKRLMTSHRSGRRRNEDRGDLETRVEETDALLQGKIEHLSRRCPPDLVGMAARADLLDLGPHLQDALAALADIERRRDLTDEELARRRAFKMLVAETLLP